MQTSIEFYGEPAIVIALFLGVGLGFLLTELLERKFATCIHRGQVHEKSQRSVDDETSFCSKVFKLYQRSRFRAGFITQLPYYIVVCILLVYPFSFMLMSNPDAPPIWLIFPLWVIILTCVTCGRGERDIERKIAKRE
ncbi:MAG: hypothetical protein ACFFDR_14490 [Candidatus Thorarchaeota archaeon]